MRDARRRLRWLLPLLWGAFTLIASFANQNAWAYPDQISGSTGRLDTACKLIDNAVQTVNAPFWFVAWFFFQIYTSLAAALVVNGVGFACWLAAVVALLRIRRRLHARPRPAFADAAPAPCIRPALSRRAFVTDSALVTGAACVGAAGVYSSFVTPWSLKLARYTVPIAGLPRALDGLRLVQLTDTHLGPRIPASFISEAVELALSLKPDVYLLTGDYVHMGTTYIEPAAALFRPLLERRAGFVGTLGVLGNHDHYADAPMMSAALAAIGVRMIDNRRLFLDPHDRELAPIMRTHDALCIAGVGDYLEGVVDIPSALHDVPDAVPRLLLSHNPDVAEHPDLVTPRRRIDLMIAGHTHGGQVRLPIIGSPAIPSRFGQKYAHGLINGPACPVLISAGVGMSLVPVRVGVRPEVVEITLTTA
jgi:predicted MPP superfamily phosphohydrolase